jgi:hypothetical protein
MPNLFRHPLIRDIFFPTFYQQPQIQHNVFVTLKTKMEELAHRTYTTFPEKENERKHHSFIRFNNETEKILSVRNSIEYKDGTTSPPELIKFYQVDQNSTKAFLNNYLWAANPLSFNDPFDCPIQLWKEESFSKSKLQDLLNPEIHHILKDNVNVNLSFLIDSQIAATGIISMHEYNESSQDVLWGYYTNQKGFSIKFDSHLLIKEWGVPFKIEYLETKELRPFSLDEIEVVGDLFPRFCRWMTQKKDFWKVENEWRFIFPFLKIETLKMDAFPEEREKKYTLTAIKEISLGLKFFDDANTIQTSDSNLYFTADSIIHQYQNQILTFLSDHQEIAVSHMFFQYDLELHPRKCKVFKEKENRFLITYDIDTI